MIEIRDRIRKSKIEKKNDLTMFLKYGDHATLKGTTKDIEQLLGLAHSWLILLNSS